MQCLSNTILTHAWKRNIHWSRCYCTGIAVSNFSMPGQAYVQIISCSKNVRQVSDIEIEIISNNGATIKKYKKGNHYEVSGFDICQVYVITISFKIVPSCGKSKVNSGVIEFP